MIKYTFSESPFFKANQSYCEKVIQNLQERNIDFTGRCDSYGYEITARLILNSRNYSLKCYKYQLPRNGVIIPNNAAEYLGIEIIGLEYSKNSSILYGRNWLKRLFMSGKSRSLIPYPFYLTKNASTIEFNFQELINFFTYYKIIRFGLYNGKLQIKIFSAFTNPVKVIEELESNFYKLL